MMEKMLRIAKLKALLWKLVLFAGTVPFLVPLYMGIERAITGISNGFMTATPRTYGLEAFAATVVMYSYLFWPTYLVGLALIILGIYKVKKG